MKLFVATLLVTAVAAEKLDNTYLPPQSARTAGGSGNFLNTPFRQAPAAPAVPSTSYGAPIAPAKPYSGPAAAPIAILRLNSDNPGDGSYKFDFETENHISQQESGQLKNAGNEEINSVHGSYSYTGTDGATYTVNYVADENGFRADGAHLPVAPAIPDEIAKALEQNAADEAAGIVDDGQYRPDHQGAGASVAASRQYLAPKPSQNQQQGGYRY